MTICNEIGCEKGALYNLVGLKAKFCSSHKTDLMKNVITKKCAENGCEIIACFNLEGQKQSLYCGTHKKIGMIDVKSKLCIETGCKKRASCNVEGQKICLYCSTHKLNGMIDIISKSCAENGCKKHPVFNVEGKNFGLFCSTHKQNGMIDVKCYKCIENGCTIQATFNIEGRKPAIYCMTHRQNGMIDVKSKLCRTHLCDTHVRDKYEGYCLRCFVHTFPDKPVSRNYKTKERATVDTVLEKFPDISWVCDKTIQDGCSKKRPDIRGDMGSHIVIIEIDENHHSLYDCSCEHKRVMEISQDVGHRPIVFIRFNPDSYTDINNQKIASCWGANKLGFMVVKPTKLKEWEDRIKSLHEQIQYWIDNVPEKTIETVQLFY
jgi:hypothetical protein